MTKAPIEICLLVVSLLFHASGQVVASVDGGFNIANEANITISGTRGHDDIAPVQNLRGQRSSPPLASRLGDTVAPNNASEMLLTASMETSALLAPSCYWASSTEALIKCADETARKHITAIANNLKRHGIFKLDLAWPGTGYNTAACGGQFQVFASLEKALGSFEVQNIIGSSGGASGAVLALSDPQRSAKTLVDVQREWTNGVSTSGEYNKYTKVLSSGLFTSVQRNGYASMTCSWNSGVSTVLHNFRDVDQASKAFAASGDVYSASGITTGYKIGSLGNCNDGGELMGIGTNPLLYYNTDYGYATGVTEANVATLFKNGVRDTVAMLLDESLQKRGNEGIFGLGGSMRIQKPQGGKWTLQQYRNYLSMGGFYEILVTGGSTRRIFKDGSSLGGADTWWR